MVLTNSFERNSDLAFQASVSNNDVSQTFDSGITKKISRKSRETYFTWGLLLFGLVLVLSSGNAVVLNSPVQQAGVWMSIAGALLLAIGKLKKWWNHATTVLFDPVDDMIME